MSICCSWLLFKATVHRGGGGEQLAPCQLLQRKMSPLLGSIAVCLRDISWINRLRYTHRSHYWRFAHVQTSRNGLVFNCLCNHLILETTFSELSMCRFNILFIDFVTFQTWNKCNIPRRTHEANDLTLLGRGEHALFLSRYQYLRFSNRHFAPFKAKIKGELAIADFTCQPTFTFLNIL